MTLDEYFLAGAWRPGLTFAERRAFLGPRAYVALNTALNPPAPNGPGTALTDKLASHARFSAARLPQPRILAVATADKPVTGEDWLSSPAATLAFLARPGTLPCFGKPVHGSQAVGGVSIVEQAGPGKLRLGNGHEVEASDLVADIWRDHARGFMFQELVRPHRDLAALIGPTIGSVRFVTTLAGAEPEVLYAVVRAPTAGSMVDSNGRVARNQPRRLDCRPRPRRRVH